jgi:hypothetical protein
MSNNEEYLRKLVDLHRKGDGTALYKIFTTIKGALNLGIYYDPSHAREYCDFEQVALTGVWKAVNSYDSTKGSTVTSWILTIVNQRLSREVRLITREHTESGMHQHDIQSSIRPDDDLDTIIFQQARDPDIFEGVKPGIDEDEFYQYINEVEEKLLRVNVKLAKLFIIKLIWPNIDRQSLATMLKVSRMSISKYFKIMRMVMESTYEAHGKDRIE